MQNMYLEFESIHCALSILAYPGRVRLSEEFRFVQFLLNINGSKGPRATKHH